MFGRVLSGIVKAILLLYLVAVVVLYFILRRLIFFPKKLAADYHYDFSSRYEELWFKAGDGTLLNGVLFKSDSSKGVIFYLHGNAGSLRIWGEIAPVYTALGYDVLMLDYRGYGKSGGVISSEEQLHADVQMVYDSLRGRYNEEKIVILGYSIGTGPAARLASANNAKMLILQAPYYRLASMMEDHYPIIPTFFLKYKLETYRSLQKCKMPVVIFHGDRDEVIDIKSSLRLKELLKPGDTLNTLHGQGHNGMSDNMEYLSLLRRVLQ